MVVVNAPGVYRPCLVLAHADAAYTSSTCRAFRRCGWDVYRAESGAEARRLARLLEAELVVLDVNLYAESGWLTCAKLHAERPDTRVILISDHLDAREWAEFVGAAALVHPGENLVDWVRQLTPLPAAG